MAPSAREWAQSQHPELAPPHSRMPIRLRRPRGSPTKIEPEKRSATTLPAFMDSDAKSNGMCCTLHNAESKQLCYFNAFSIAASATGAISANPCGFGCSPSFENPSLNMPLESTTAE